LTCPRCRAVVTVALVGGLPVETVPVGREELLVLAMRDGTAVAEGRIRGDLGDPAALRAVHRRHGCDGGGK